MVEDGKWGKSARGSSISNRQAPSSSSCVTIISLFYYHSMSIEYSYFDDTSWISQLKPIKKISKGCPIKFRIPGCCSNLSTLTRPSIIPMNLSTFFHYKFITNTVSPLLSNRSPLLPRIALKLLIPPPLSQFTRAQPRRLGRSIIIRLQVGISTHRNWLIYAISPRRLARCGG